MRLKTKIDELKADPRYQFHVLGHAGRRHDGRASSARSSACPAKGKPISIIDVSGVPSDITSVVVAVLCRLVFDLRDLVAQRAAAADPARLRGGAPLRARRQERRAARRSRKILERIAKEGRKYGVSLGLITQRPSDLAEGVLSQCGTIISMRLNNDRDQAFVKSGDARRRARLPRFIPALRNRECIICGEGVAIPIRVAFDDLERDRRPASADPLFSELWRETGDEEAMVSRVVKRWRSQGR